VSAYGGSTKFFGPYVLNVGCFIGAVFYADNVNLVLNSELVAGDDPTNAYTFAFPTATRAWCTVQQNEIREEDGSEWIEAAKFSP